MATAAMAEARYPPDEMAGEIRSLAEARELVPACRRCPLYGDAT